MPPARCPLACLVAPLALLAWAATADAGFVTYAGSGYLDRSATETNNPWNLALGGNAFQWSLEIDDSAFDVNATVNTVQFNGSSIRSATFSIGGVNGTVVPSAASTPLRLVLVDGALDVVTFDMGVNINGTTLAVYGQYELPDSTFAFASVREAPPAFVAQTTQRTEVGIGTNPYITRVNADTTLAATPMATPAPAPPGLVLMLSSLATFGLGAVTRRLRARRAA